MGLFGPNANEKRLEKQVQDLFEENSDHFDEIMALRDLVRDLQDEIVILKTSGKKPEIGARTRSNKRIDASPTQTTHRNDDDVDTALVAVAAMSMMTDDNYSSSDSSSSSSDSSSSSSDSSSSGGGE